MEQKPISAEQFARENPGMMDAIGNTVRRELETFFFSDFKLTDILRNRRKKRLMK